MKKNYVIAGIIIIVVVVIVCLLMRKKEEIKTEIKDIVYFHFSYSNGYMANAHIIYEINYDEKENKYMVSVKPYGVPDEKKVVVLEPDGFRDKVKDILIKYDLAKWNGFKKYAKDVLDGDDFSFYVKMEDNQKIDADGYMMWPDNYRSVRDEFDKLFMKIYNDEKGIKENE